jgi:uncharacterized membrane protein
MQTDTARSPHFLVRGTKRLESTTALDAAAKPVDAAAAALVASPGRRNVLHGEWLGHAVHPLMTDLPIGFWTSTMVLDLVGGERSRPAADLLLAAGVATAVPAAVTGLAEYAPAGRREKRVAVVHATANTVALTCYVSSMMARRRGNRAAGVLLGLCGGAATAVAGYLGGHLISARKVSTRHPEFEQDGAAHPVDLTAHRPRPSSPVGP